MSANEIYLKIASVWDLPLAAHLEFFAKIKIIAECDFLSLEIRYYFLSNIILKYVGITPTELASNNILEEELLRVFDLICKVT